MIEIGETNLFHTIYADQHYCPHEDEKDNAELYLNAETVLPIVSRMEKLLKDADAIIEWAAYVSDKSSHQTDCYNWISNFNELIEDHGLLLELKDFTREQLKEDDRYFE